jgi:hypothetical protein
MLGGLGLHGNPTRLLPCHGDIATVLPDQFRGLDLKVLPDRPFFFFFFVCNLFL